MQYAQFITDFQSTNSLWSKPVICFTGSEYSLFLFAAIAAQKERFGVSQAVTFDMSVASLKEHRAGLETLFLGQKSWYFLSAREEGGVAARTAWIEYLQSYQGPHTIWCFLKDVPSKHVAHWNLITIPDYVDKSLFNTLLASSGQMDLVRARPFVESLYKKERQISFDTAYLLMRYANLVGSTPGEFFDSWIHQFVPQDESLFSLSQFFFSKQTNKFFELWAVIASRYGAPFWITFWSEQLWRAACYTKAMMRQDSQEARKVGYRLPFLYLKRDWKQYSIDELQRAHQAVCELDFDMKNGAHDSQLDLFLHAFLQNDFKKNT